MVALRASASASPVQRRRGLRTFDDSDDDDGFDAV